MMKPKIQSDQASKREVGVRFKYLNLKEQPQKERSLPAIRKRKQSTENSGLESSLESSFPLLRSRESKSKDERARSAKKDLNQIRSIFFNVSLNKKTFQPLNQNMNSISNIHQKYMSELNRQRRSVEKESPNKELEVIPEKPLHKLEEFNSLSLKVRLKLANLARNFVFTSTPTKSALFKFARLAYDGMVYASSIEKDPVEYFPEDIILNLPVSSLQSSSQKKDFVYRAYLCIGSCLSDQR